MDMEMGTPVEVDETHQKLKDSNNDPENNNEMSQSEFGSQQSSQGDDKGAMGGNGSRALLDLEENMSQGEVLSQRESKTSSPSESLTVIRMLDQMEERIDKLRAEAMKLETEKDEIVTGLESLRNSEMVNMIQGIELDEINRYLDRLGRRCKAVLVEIRAERSPPQLESLHKVNNMIDSLILDSKHDPLKTRRRCIIYINTCSEQEVTSRIPEIDSKFESAILGCCIEDQKHIKKRLTGLYSYFKSTTRSFAVMEEEEEVDDVIDVNEAIERSLQSQ